MAIESNAIQNEPLAIIGMGCRFPGGASSPAQLWKLLCGGVDAITDVPPDRWDIRRFFDPDPDKPGKTYVKQAGFLQEDIYRFDPLFFGISPREAPSVDPQQRLLLEVTWEALEDAGLQAEKINGSATGVFIGGFCMDHSNQLLLNEDIANTYTGVGSAMTILSARISYVFNLKGPCIALDTACSSSLVATHYACQSIWNGECSMAIAGGVNVMTNPRNFALMGKGKFLSPHCRCKAFDEDASGYARGEGAGIVLIKPLSLALKDKDHIYALIRATGVNHDGQTSGITIPNPAAQEALIRKVQARAKVSPGEVQYIEAHGTGTQAGDTAEAGALHAALSEGREPGNKCLVGSIKTNIGHLEAAAGVAGLIKTALCLKHKMIPGSLHFNRPNPLIPFDQLCIRVATGLEKWPEGNKTAYAGVNSFGFGGTNAHVLLQEAPETKAQKAAIPAPELNPGHFLIPVSARDESALKQLARKYHDFLEQDPRGKTVSMEDFAYSTAMRRSHHNCRLAVIAPSRGQLAENLKLFAAGEMPQFASFNRVMPAEARKAVFVYSGMGPHWWAMGRELMKKEPVFLRVLEECDHIFKEYSGWSIIQELSADECESRMGETQVAQPAGFALQAALTALWKQWGIEPAAVAGHSVGEIAAAYVSGALSLRDALKVGYHRSRLQQRLAGGGTMLAAALPEEKAALMLENFDGVSIAAVNSSADVSLSGEENVLQKISGLLDAEEVFNRFLRVQLAYHSYQMEPIKEELVSCLSGIQAHKAGIALYSTVTGNRMNGDELGAGYWWRNVREPVRFKNAIDALIKDGYGVFVEVGPHPVLGNYIKQALREAGISGHVLSSLNRKQPEPEKLLESLGYLYTLGFSPNWRAITPEAGYAALPGYPWQKEHYRQDSQLSMEDKLGAGGHVFLNNDLRLPQPAWEVELNEQFFPYLKDHCIQKTVVFPGAAYVEAGLALNERNSGQKECVLEDMALHKMLIFDGKRKQKIQFHFNPGTKECSVYSRADDTGGKWEIHASGRILPPIPDENVNPVDLNLLRKRCPEEMPVAEFYRRLDGKGLNYGPYFQSVNRLWKGNGEFLAEIRGHEAFSYSAGGYLLHPAIMDAAVQALVELTGSDASGNNNSLFIPASLERVSFYSSPGRQCFSHGKITRETPEALYGDILIFDEAGNIAVNIRGLKCQLIQREEQEEKDAENNLLYEFNWYKADAVKIPGEVVNAGSWIVFAAENNQTRALMEYIASRVTRCVTVYQGDTFRKIKEGHYFIRKEVPEDFEALFAEEKDMGFDTVLYLGGLQETADDEFVNDEDAIEHCVYVTNIVKALAGARVKNKIAMGIVTNGAQAVKEDEKLWNLTAAPLWGLGRLITNEHPDLHCKLVDVSSPLSDDEMKAVLDEFLQGNNDEDVALRPGERFIKQLDRLKHKTGEASPETKKTTTSNPVMLDILKPGKLDSLVYREIARTPPGPGEIGVEVHFSALNYKDFLKIMGVVPKNVIEGTYLGNSFGGESSGRVVATGEGVREFRAGDEVLVHCKGLKSYDNVPAFFAGLKPERLSFAEAPVFLGFITAYYGLAEIARLQKGERVLIHNATGGVGQAAVQVARWIGAEIFATAGSEEKRDFLRKQGIKHVMNSRSLKFADDVKAITGGEGVDVVLNAIAGESLLKSLSILAPYGRFVEIGKTDISKNNNLPLQFFNKNLTFSALDMDRLAKERPHVLSRLLRTVGKLLDEGHFTAMPVQVFPAAQATEAFHLMGQSRHIGKVVLDMRNQEVPVLPGSRAGTLFKKDATYLITGGTGGFGLKAAIWLSSKGAGSLVLVSRSGASEETNRAMETIRHNGAAVTALPVDVTDENQVERLIKEIITSLPPLRGIIHGAMVLDDGFLVDMNKERYARVMSPKAGGALNLHKHTLDAPLDFFISFSSISSLIGNAGQANYIAANAFLDAFAHFRRAKGLPATTVNLGVLSETGVAVRQRGLEEIFKSLGIRSLTPREALGVLEEILKMNPVQIGLFDVDWQQWAEAGPDSVVPSRIRRLVGKNTSKHKLDRKEIIKRKLSAFEPYQRQELAETMLRKIFSGVLRIPVSKVLPDQNILVLGMDSMMALELRHLVKRELSFEISVLELLKGPTITRMSKLFLDSLDLPPYQSREELAEEDEEMSGDELDKYFVQLIDSMKKNV